MPVAFPLSETEVETLVALLAEKYRFAVASGFDASVEGLIGMCVVDTMAACSRPGVLTDWAEASRDSTVPRPDDPGPVPIEVDPAWLDTEHSGKRRPPPPDPFPTPKPRRFPRLRRRS